MTQPPNSKGGILVLLQHLQSKNMYQYSLYIGQLVSGVYIIKINKEMYKLVKQ